MHAWNLPQWNKYWIACSRLEPKCFQHACVLSFQCSWRRHECRTWLQARFRQTRFANAVVLTYLDTIKTHGESSPSTQLGKKSWRAQTPCPQDRRSLPLGHRGRTALCREDTPISSGKMCFRLDEEKTRQEALTARMLKMPFSQRSMKLGCNGQLFQDTL